MAKQVKKSSKNLKRKSTKRNDIVLAVLLGVVVTGVGLIVTRYSSASTSNANKSFTRDPITQMQGGSVVKKANGQQVRIASQTAPGINPVFTIVSKAEMENTQKVCVEYLVKKPGTWINVTYNSPTQGLSTSPGTTKDSGTGIECVDRGGVVVGGTININVTPGAAQITKVYGVLRDARD